MSSDPEPSPTREAAESTSSWRSSVTDVLRVAAIPIVVGLLGLLAVIVVWVADVPSRSLALTTLVLSGFVPYFATLVFLVLYVLAGRISRPVLYADPDSEEIGLEFFSPSFFASTEVDGSLDRRHSTRDGRTVHIAEGLHAESRDRVQDDGSVSPEKIVVLDGTWSGSVSYWQFLEDKDTLVTWRDELVPIVQSALQVRASADSKVVRNSVSVGRSLIAGAEADEFAVGLKDMSDFDLGVREDTPSLDDFADGAPSTDTQPLGDDLDDLDLSVDLDQDLDGDVGGDDSGQ
ncbi:hypothetical protein [Halarchaeum nitratireducens]|uniref:Uncharacterized protein n=1 Tax=Halarchaeum nitratireducens TaxID=489913 RepID=A0A830GCQ4_9EURY|nr:hypothetical protein [Halarchaeum nitratireducens]GGN18744.1 hypothetical protein GCM10009021_19730 [Halarchaeum nitratireducens]